MITLQTLLEKLQETYSCSIKNGYDTNRFISRVDVLQIDTILDENTLYLCPPEVASNPEMLCRYAALQTQFAQMEKDPMLSPVIMMEMPDSGCSDHESICSVSSEDTVSSKNMDSSKHIDTAFMENSILFVTHMPDISELFSFLNHRLNFEFRLQQEINDLYHLLYSGRGLEDLIIRAESFLHRPMSVLDASYSLIAISPLMHQLPFGMEKSKEGTFLSSQEVESLRRLQIEHQIYQNNQAFFIQTEDHPDTNWIFCAIRIQHVMTGYVALCLPDQADASEHELRLITAFSDICAIEMQKHEFFVQNTGLQYETFLTELLEGRFNDVNVIEARLKLLNRHFGKFFCLAILYCSHPHNSDLFNKRQMAALRQVYPNAMSVVYKNNIILLINQDTPVQLNEKLTDPLERFAQRNQLKVSLSQPFADVLKIRIFYNQALHTLELSDLQTPDQYLYYSTDALPEYLFSNCDYQGLEVGIHYHIFQLQDYDKTYHTDFIETLRAYLDHDRNAAKTAEFLHIHRSTFFYRVKKIEELLEISLTDSHLLFLYELSFKIWDYLCR